MGDANDLGVGCILEWQEYWAMADSVRFWWVGALLLAVGPSGPSAAAIAVALVVRIDR